MDTPFPLGKLPADVLARLLASVAPTDPRVLVGPGIGLDAAVIDMGDRLLVAKSDPITFATDSIGWYAVQVNANDIVTTGATPRWFLATVLLPARPAATIGVANRVGSRADEALAQGILTQIHRACVGIGASLVGGHTEITYGLDRPIVVGAMLGEVTRERLVTPSGARPGDALLLTKGIAIEGTALIAREKAGELREFGDEFLQRCRNFLIEPGISIVRDAAIAISAGRVHAMHDPTEGGLATGLHEMAQAAGIGLTIDSEAVPVYPETLAVCRATGLDPWGLIASGALLLAVEAADAQNIVRALKAEGIGVAIIGQATQAASGVTLRVRQPQGLIDLPHFERDEITRLFE
jgi:hydrogenase expression/formation protein HypE